MSEPRDDDETPAAELAELVTRIKRLVEDESLAEPVDSVLEPAERSMELTLSLARMLVDALGHGASGEPDGEALDEVLDRLRDKSAGRKAPTE